MLAGGMGTRLGNLAGELPKPMAPVEGRPFLEYLLDYWIGQGIRRFVLSVGWRYEAVEKHFGRSYGGVRLDYSVEQELLGTGGGLLQAHKQVRKNDSFLVLNGDTFFEVPFREFMIFHEAREAEMTLALARMEKPDRYETVAMDGTNRILDFKTRSGAGGGAWINGGVYLMSARCLAGGHGAPGGKLSLENQILPGLLAAERKIYGFPAAGRFLDIGVPESYQAARDVLCAKKGAL